MSSGDAGGVDARPVDRAEIVLLLRGARRAASASEASCARPPMRATRVARSAMRKSPRKARLRLPRAAGDRRALLGARENRVDDRRMSGARATRRALSASARIDLRGGLGAIGLAAADGRSRRRRTSSCARRRSAAPPRPAPAASAAASARASTDLPVPDRPPTATSIAAAAARSAQRQAEIGRGRLRDIARASSSARSLRAAVTLARIAARSDRNSGSAASASRSSSRRVSTR